MTASITLSNTFCVDTNCRIANSLMTQYKYIQYIPSPSLLIGFGFRTFHRNDEQRKCLASPIKNTSANFLLVMQCHQFNFERFYYCPAHWYRIRRQFSSNASTKHKAQTQIPYQLRINHSKSASNFELKKTFAIRTERTMIIITN